MGAMDMESLSKRQKCGESTRAHVVQVDGAPFPLLPITSSETLRRCRAGPKEGSKPTVLICSYPKSGTTWLQNIVATLVSAEGGTLELSHISDYTPFYEADSTWSKLDGGEHAICKNHSALGRCMFNTHLYPDMLPKNSKVIYVMRRGKDVVHSFFQHLTHEIIDDKVSFEGTFNEFATDWMEGKLPFGRWTEHIKVWRENQLPNVLYLSYEEMKKDLKTAVHEVAQFLELDLAKDAIDELVPNFTIDAMKSDRKRFEPVSVQWKEGFNFVRKGIVGDSEKSFDEETARAFNNFVAEAWPDGVPEWARALVT